MSLQQAYENVKNGNATIDELISVICGRNKDVCIQSAYALSQYGENRLKQNGFTEKEARKIQAAFQLMDFANQESKKPEYIHEPHDAIHWLKEIAYKAQEHFVVIALDNTNKVLGMSVITIGKANETMVPSRDILRFAVNQGANRIIISHSHPSFNCTPSDADMTITEKIKNACALIAIELTDHIIVGGNCYLSMKQKGYF